MPNKRTDRRTTMIKPASLQRARIACSMTGDSILNFVSDAVDQLAEPILKKHVKLPPAGIAKAS